MKELRHQPCADPAFHAGLLLVAASAAELALRHGHHQAVVVVVAVCVECGVCVVCGV